MGRKFNIPEFYRSSIISTLKNARRAGDTRKKDFSPALLDLGPLRFKIARHFGFCFGVENAIEIAYRALRENPGKRVYLLSEMIHNTHVNNDLRSRGVQFLLATDGSQLIPFDILTPEDIVIVPAFGTTVELFQKLASLGVNPLQYNATCPFVEKVWKRAESLGEQGYTVIVHGKHTHEETRATFSHARLTAPTLVIRDMAEAQLLARYLKRELPFDGFAQDFAGRYSAGFEPQRDLVRIGVVNQTTMLASETQAISDLLRQAIRGYFSETTAGQYFADTRDTLCYATWENQESVLNLIADGADLAIVVGGYNSSNTSHLVELCEQRMPTFYVKDADEILSRECIRHLNLHSHQVVESTGWLPTDRSVLNVILTAGASCPDVLVDQVLIKVASYFGVESSVSDALDRFVALYQDSTATDAAHALG